MLRFPSISYNVSFWGGQMSSYATERTKVFIDILKSAMDIGSLMENLSNLSRYTRRANLPVEDAMQAG